MAVLGDWAIFSVLGTDGSSCMNAYRFVAETG